MTLSPRSGHPLGGSTLQMGVQDGKATSKEVHGGVQGGDGEADPGERANGGFRGQRARRSGWDLQMNKGDCTLLIDGQALFVLDRETGGRRAGVFDDWREALF